MQTAERERRRREAWAIGAAGVVGITDRNGDAGTDQTEIGDSSVVATERAVAMDVLAVPQLAFLKDAAGSV
jgi:hypothetical protein